MSPRTQKLFCFLLQEETTLTVYSKRNPPEMMRRENVEKPLIMHKKKKNSSICSLNENLIFTWITPEKNPLERGDFFLFCIDASLCAAGVIE